MTTIKRTPDPIGVSTLMLIIVILAIAFFLFSCSPSFIERTYRYHYDFKVLSGQLNRFEDDQLHYPGDTIVFFPSKVKIVIVDVQLAKR